ncbi:hypothetical protein [Massilia phyllosphaerae]|uniref:hypothetical protein n=1 Tax=Massilia phyllosphaerae TaxID=3106034 RepID=UPI002B1CD30C|nr:hypothetical protein [Massilia sp. SGZ-792]
MRTSSLRRQGPKFAALTCSLLVALTANAAKPDPVHDYGFQIVAADDSAITRRIAEDLVKRLVPIFGKFRTELAQRRRTLYVAIGPSALRDVAARRCDCVVVSAFTSSQVYRAIAARLAPTQAAAITAVYAEPAPADQLRLAALLYRRPVRVAALLGADTAFLKPALAFDKVTVLDAGQGDNSGGNSGAKNGDDINDLLNRIAQTDVLLALPDAAIYNADNFRNILLSTYRHKQGVIGFSADMVKAGALGTTYSEVEDINTQVAEIAAAYVAGGQLPAPQFPRYFRTIVNEGVAKSLEVTVDDAARHFARRPPGATPAPPP